MLYLDCYAIPEGEKGYIEGFPEATYAVDVDKGTLNKVLLQLSENFAEIRKVKETNGQSIIPLSSVIAQRKP